MRQGLPVGLVTLVFTDIEGSTRLLEELGLERYGELLAQHHRVCRVAWAEHGGVEVDTAGDAFFVVFESASGALAAAREAQEALTELGLRVRMGVHTGEVAVNETGYVGFEVHRAARIAAAAHGGQVVVSETTAAAAGPNGLIELGEHRFKDLDEPVAIFQLGEGSFPPLKTISNTNLPRPASSFVGREAELGAVLARFEQGARLVTLTGPGGSGKTRLSLEAAATLVPHFKAGVFWVGLASLRDPALVTETVGQTLGAKDGLAEHIGERELLLLLDNLEQVIDAAPDLSALLRSCPNLRLLVTSRELLRVEGEVEYPVPPLAEPEAVALFCDRAQTEPSDEIRELCARLDNLPLAVELAAARTKALSPAQILERLSQRLDLLKGGRDADPRQQTLRATIEWSYDLLDNEAQRLFRALSVFAGGCTLEAAEQVAEADLDTLQSLVEKSLLRFTSERYWMLETIREYAYEQLESSGQVDDSRAAHAHHYLEIVEALAPGVMGGEQRQAEAYERLDDELHNVRRALQFSLESDPELLVRLVAGFGRFLFIRGYDIEGGHLAAVASHTGAGTTAARATVLRFAGRSALNLRDLDEARRFFEEALTCARQACDGELVSEALRGLGDVAVTEGDNERARYLYEEARAESEARGNDWSTTAILSSLANLALTECRWADAYDLSTEGVVRCEAIGNYALAAVGRANLGLSALRLGRRFEAEAAFAAVIAGDVVDPETVAVALDGLAWLLADAGHATVAAEALGAAAELLDRVGTTQGAPERELQDEVTLQVSGLMSSDEFGEAIRRGRALSLEEAGQRSLAALD